MASRDAQMFARPPSGTLRPSIWLRRFLLGVLLVCALASSAAAQSLNEAISAALSVPSLCAGLSGPSQGTQYGPSLTLLCTQATNGGGQTSGAQLSGGYIAQRIRLDPKEDERRVAERLRQRRAGRQSPGKGDSPDKSYDLDGPRLAFAGDDLTIETRAQPLRQDEPEMWRRASGSNAYASSEFGPLGVFLAGEYTKFNKDQTRFEPGYDSDSFGGTIGVDYWFTRWLVGGVALNYSHVDGDFDRSGGNFDIHSYGAQLYLGFVPAPGFFLDAVAGYARQRYSIERRISFSQLTGDPNTPPQELRSTTGIAGGHTNGDEYTASVTLGYDVLFGNVTVGPRLGLHYKHATIDGFAESGQGATLCSTSGGVITPTCTERRSTGLEVIYRRHKQDWLTSVVGLFGSMTFRTSFGVLVPHAMVEYLHEFEDDQRVVYFRLVEDRNRTKLRFQTDPPDRDYFSLGGGVILALPNGVSAFASYREGFVGYRAQSSHTVALGIRFVF